MRLSTFCGLHRDTEQLGISILAVSLLRVNCLNPEPPPSALSLIPLEINTPESSSVRHSTEGRREYRMSWECDGSSKGEREEAGKRRL